MCIRDRSQGFHPGPGADLRHSDPEYGLLRRGYYIPSFGGLLYGAGALDADSGRILREPDAYSNGMYGMPAGESEG